MKKILLAVLFFFSFLSVFAQRNALYSSTLRKFVVNGLVNYEGLKNDDGLNEYLQSAAEVNPDKLSRNEKLAFWINVYNAFTMKIVADNYPIGSINDLHAGGRIIGHILGKTVWDNELIEINKKEYSLNDIEHKILRKMNEPRIHFAIVCASIGCPELRAEPYAADKIDIQLEDQAKIFLNDDARNSFDVSEKTARLSKIFDWFNEDFGEEDKNVLQFISKYVRKRIAEAILNDVDEWEINYKDYNWNLNEFKK